MLRGLKEFIKANLLTDSHPLIMSLYQNRQLRIQDRKIRMMSSALSEYDRISHMSYEEAESAIGRRYLETFGRTLSWENPQTFNEKINVSKLYMPSTVKTRLADKYLVREWITQRIGSEYLIPLLGVYDSFDEIDFDALPDSFVIKCNHDCGSVTLVKDKRRIDRDILRRKYDVLMRRNYAWVGWEMHYRDIPRKIMIEKYMGYDINDYKFFCFDGVPYVCSVEMDRFTGHRRNFYNLNWERQPFSLNYPNSPQNPERPQKFEKMKEIAEELSKEIPHVRVDLYYIDGHIYTGEMTFTHANGFQRFTPDEWDYKLGSLWPFDNTARAKVLAKYSRPLDYHP